MTFVRSFTICPFFAVFLRFFCGLSHFFSFLLECFLQVFRKFFSDFRLPFAGFSHRFQRAYLYYMRFYRNGYDLCSRFSFRSRRTRFSYINYSQAAAKYPTFSPFCGYIYRFDKLIFELACADFYFGVDFAFSRVYYLIIKSANRRC